MYIQLKSRATGSVIDALDPTSIADTLIPRLDSTDEIRLGDAAEREWTEIAHALSTVQSEVSGLESMIVQGYEQAL